jgi:hypothetical protein
MHYYQVQVLFLGQGLEGNYIIIVLTEDAVPKKILLAQLQVNYMFLIVKIHGRWTLAMEINLFFRWYYY